MSVEPNLTRDCNPLSQAEMPIGFRRNSWRLYNNGIRYRSRSEIACSILLQKVLPTWTPVEGKTYNVPVGQGCSVDFVIPEHKLVVEHHPLTIRHEMVDRGAANKLDRLLYKMPGNVRRELLEALSDDYTARYYKDRRRLLNYSLISEFAGYELVVTTSPEDFASSIYVRLGGKRSEGIAEFKRIINSKKGI